MSPIFSSVLELVGKTPIVRLNRLGRESDVELLAKLDFLNPGGSTKDRPIIQMFKEAVKRGEVGPSTTIVDSSSGNFAIAMAMAGAVEGHRVICVVDPKLTTAVRNILLSMGAELRHSTKKDKSGSYLRDRLRLRDKLLGEISGAWCPDQYSNRAGIRSHYEGTGREILADVDNELDALVIATGTGATISGTARLIKKHIPGVKVVAADALGSKIFDDELHPWLQKGVGSGLRAEELDNLDLDVIDEVRLIGDNDAFMTARALARNEGILAGGSSGCAAFAALTLSRELSPRSRVVTILPDRIERYLDEHPSDEWMLNRGLSTDVDPESIWSAVEDWHENSRVFRGASGLPVHKVPVAV